MTDVDNEISRDAAFCDNVSNIANQICFEEDPDCPHCPLLADCPTPESTSSTCESTFLLYVWPVTG